MIVVLMVVALIIISTIGIAAICVLINLFKLQKRNHQIHIFRMHILEKCHKWSTAHLGTNDAWEFFLSLPSYHTMLYSRKPLTMKSWIDDDTIIKFDLQ